MRRLLTFGCFCLLACPRIADAEWHLTPLVGLTFGGNTSLFDPDLGTGKIHPNLGGSVSLLGKGLFGVEGIVVLTPNFFKGDGGLIESSRSLVVMGNVILTAPRRWTEYNLRPFVSGGLGLLQASYEETTSPLLPLSGRFAAFNIGGGAVGFLSSRTGLRFDLRYYSSLPGQGPDTLVPPLTSDKIHVRYMTFSVGLVLRR
jgi:hypothetical protein